MKNIVNIYEYILTKLDLKHILNHINNIGCEVKKLDITYEQQAKLFKALSDEKRLRILGLLRDGEECACVLGEQLDMAQSSLSYHIKILYESGIVDSRQDGKWTHYRISERGSSFAVELLKSITTPNIVISTGNCCKK